MAVIAISLFIITSFGVTCYVTTGWQFDDVNYEQEQDSLREK